MLLRWGEDELKNLTMVGFGDSMVVGTIHAIRSGNFGGIAHFSGQIEKNQVFFSYCLQRWR
jgi:hypothetical protein